MALTTAERNRRKRERKKREREEHRKEEDEERKAEEQRPDENVEIEYVAEAINVAEDMESVMRRFQQRAAVVTDDEKATPAKDSNVIVASNLGDDDDDDDKKPLSKRKLRELTRPSVAELKRRVKHPDLVEAHDVTAPDADFLIELKAISGTVPVPRHWGRKRKYLQGKRGFEKQPFQLPDFLVKTGITVMRDALSEDQNKMSQKQKNRARVAPKMGAVDIDYRTLYDSFFKHQTKPDNLTGFGDLYYEGKELETRSKLKPGGELSQALREALGMTLESSPPPWLINMQRYGPPPSYPNLKIPGLNAPLPNGQCQYGYHVGGWGKPPVDRFGRSLYGGNPFDAPGGGVDGDAAREALVTSDGKTITKTAWGALPSADFAEADEEESEEEEESSEEEEMEEFEGEEEEEANAGGTESVLPPPPTEAPSAVDLRKQAGDETPLIDTGPKQLYTILEERRPDQQSGEVFSSDVAYAVPGAATVPDGAESVLSKAVAPNDGSKRKRKHDDDDDKDALDKNFKF
jgi:splicing factor 3B subunit 2